MTRRTSRRIGTIACLLLVAAATVDAQQFEVASVRLNTAGGRPVPSQILPQSGQVTITNTTVVGLIQTAYDIPLPSLISGLPDWARTQRVDVVAKAARPASVRELERMLQPLLAEHFKLAVRWETREMDALELVAVPGGATLKPTTATCEGPRAGRPACGLQPQEGPGRIGAIGIDMKAFAAVLAPSQRRPVLDRTGLTGRYDLQLAYTPDAFNAASLGQRGGAVPPGVDPHGPPLATALRDQLGLELRPVKAFVETLLVTRIEPLPSQGARRLVIPALEDAPPAVTLAADHVWQSTGFAAIAALLALAFRRRQAQVRYWLWMAASLKFLVPFAALAMLGSAVSWRTIEVIPYENPMTLIETVGQPFTQTEVAIRPTGVVPSTGVRPLSIYPALLVVWGLGAAAVLMVWLVRWQRVRRTLAHAQRIDAGREVDVIARLAARDGVRPLPIYETDTTLEPGVFGIVRPVLLWPRGITAHLNAGQIEAILAHELCHLRRRDNLAAALHMVSQTMFWFHPMVWWIGGRLVDERERACDEDVLGRGSEPEIYAESILKTCKYFVESPLACVAGVTGSDLKKRIEQIMTNDVRRPLPFWRQILLAAAGVVAFATPVVLGALNPPPQTRDLPAPATLPAFEETSIRPNPSPGRGGRGGQMQPTRFQSQNVTLRTLIKVAYAIEGVGGTPGGTQLFDQQIAGGPDWLDTDKFDIVATTPAATQPTPGPQTRLMLQRMLADRFGFRAHWETRELPVYALVRVQPNGPLAPGLTPMNDEECEKVKPLPLQPGQMPEPGRLPGCGGIQFGPGMLNSGGVPVEWFAAALVTIPAVSGIDRIVVDRTGLQGRYRFTMTFSPAGASGAPDPARAELFTAIQEQLGFRLDPMRAPIDVLVIDAAEKPQPN